MDELRIIAALAADYRFTGTIAFTLFFALVLRLLGAEVDIVFSILVLGCATAVYEHRCRSDQKG
jgi:hypothetical protein